MEIRPNRTPAYVCSLQQDDPQDQVILLNIKRTVKAGNENLKRRLSYSPNHQGALYEPRQRVCVKKRAKGRIDVYIHNL